MIDALIKRTTLIVRDMNASSQWYEASSRHDSLL